MGLQLAFSYPENPSPCVKKSVYNWAFHFHTYTEVEPSALARYSLIALNSKSDCHKSLIQMKSVRLKFYHYRICHKHTTLVSLTILH